MSDLYKTILSLCQSRNINITQMCKESGASRASLTDLKMGRKQSLSAETLTKIANYFGVSVDYLLNGEKEKSPVRSEQENDIKEALTSMRQKALDGVTLMYDGEPIDEETMEAFEASLRFAIKVLEDKKRKG